MNSNWPKWFHASLNKHFFSYQKPDFPAIIEGQNRPNGNFYEVRIDGPDVEELSHNWFEIFCDVNILIQTKLDSTDLYKVHRNAGILLSAFTNSINIYKLGDGDGLLGCMLLDTGVFTQQAGQIASNVNIIQANLIGSYRITLEE